MDVAGVTLRVLELKDFFGGRLLGIGFMDDYPEVHLFTFEQLKQIAPPSVWSVSYDLSGGVYPYRFSVVVDGVRFFTLGGQVPEWFLSARQPA